MFIFFLLGVGLPCRSIFCQFWLCKEVQCVYLRRHLGSLLSNSYMPQNLSTPGHKLSCLENISTLNSGGKEVSQAQGSLVGICKGFQVAWLGGPPQRQGGWSSVSLSLECLLMLFYISAALQSLIEKLRRH